MPSCIYIGPLNYINKGTITIIQRIRKKKPIIQDLEHWPFTYNEGIHLRHFPMYVILIIRHLLE